MGEVLATSNSEGKLKSHTGLTCQVCGGAINVGEMAHIYMSQDGGTWACHWFKCKGDT